MPSSPKLLTLVWAILLVLVGSVIVLFVAYATADRHGRVMTDVPPWPAASRPAAGAQL